MIDVQTIVDELETNEPVLSYEEPTSDRRIGFVFGYINNSETVAVFSVDATGPKLLLLIPKDILTTASLEGWSKETS